MQVKLFLFITFLLLTSLHSKAQVLSINGQVTDATNNEPLPGATVYIEELRVGAITDVDGYFKIPVKDHSPHNLLITFMGYESQTVEFDGKTFKNIEVRLKPNSIGIEAINVSGKANGQVKAMVDQENADNIKNIVSYEQIEQFPDMNSAEVLGRISGVTLKRDQGEGRFVQLRGTPPELTNFNVNGEQIPSPEGNVRYVGLDVISANQIEFIEVTKVLTSDMDADGIGGSVNIITKSAKNEKPEWKFSIANGYNNLMKSFNNPIIQAGYNQKVGKFGISLNGSYYLNHQGAEDLEYKYDKQPFWGSQESGVENYHLQYREVQLRHYITNRERIGASANLNYAYTEKGNLYLRGMFNKFTEEQERRRKIYDLDDAINEYYYLYGGIVHDIKARSKIQNISTVNLGGDQDFNFMKADYEVSLGLATEEEPDRIEASFNSPGQAIQMKFNLDDPNWPTIYFPREADTINAYDYDNYDFDEMLFRSSTVKDLNKTVKANFEIPYELTPWNKGSFKIGGKVRMKEKTREVDATMLTNFKTSGYTDGLPTIDDISLTTFTDDFYKDNLLDHGYEMSHMPNPDKLRDYYNNYEDYFYKSKKYVLPESEGLDYTAYENIYAVYGMVKHDIGKVMILAGLRYERTDIEYHCFDVNLDNYPDSAVTSNSDKRSHEFLLPNIQVKYKVNDHFNLRGALTYTYSRPNFEDVLPYTETDREEQRSGTPDLAYPLSTNVDFLIEKYFNGGNMLSGGLFYKNIDDFIFYYKRFSNANGTGGGRTRITTAENGIEAYVYGAEIAFQNKFNILPGAFSNLGIYTNYTYTYSEALIYKRQSGNEYGDNTGETEILPLPGQAEHTLNFSIFYDTPKFYAKIALNYHSAFLDDLGADKDLDNYYDEALHLDFNAYYEINKHWKVFTDWVNLTNAPLKYYLGDPNTVLKQEYYSWNARIGLKFSL